MFGSRNQFVKRELGPDGTSDALGRLHCASPAFHLVFQGRMDGALNLKALLGQVPPVMDPETSTLTQALYLGGELRKQS